LPQPVKRLLVLGWLSELHPQIAGATSLDALPRLNETDSTVGHKSAVVEQIRPRERQGCSRIEAREIPLFGKYHGPWAACEPQAFVM